jgi:transposase InsO family protein
MPPASRNQRAPTAGDTPASTAAVSLDWPDAIAAQKRRRCSPRATPGRPGDRCNTARNARSERRFPVLIATSSAKVLRRPSDTTLAAAQAYRRLLEETGMLCSMSRKGDCWDCEYIGAAWRT